MEGESSREGVPGRGHSMGKGPWSLRQRDDGGGRWRQDGRALLVLLRGLDLIQWELMKGLKQRNSMTTSIRLLP